MVCGTSCDAGVELSGDGYGGGRVRSWVLGCCCERSSERTEIGDRVVQNETAGTGMDGRIMEKETVYLVAVGDEERRARAHKDIEGRDVCMWNCNIAVEWMRRAR